MIKQRLAPETLAEAVRYFADPDVAFAFIVQLRWPAGVACPECGGADPSLIASRRLWQCKACRKQFSVKAGTIFEDSPLGLDKWLPAVWLLVNAKNGISSYELHRAIGVTQKTAWFMLSRIRLAMQSSSFDKLDGEVEVDEAYIGGKVTNMHKSKRARMPHKGMGHGHMKAVVGMLQRKRGGRPSTVRVAPVATVRRHELDAHVQRTVEKGAAIYTDYLDSYRSLAKNQWKDIYTHAAINHAVRYAEGAVHTNGLENFWSLLKRSIKGTYVSVDPFHLFRYLDEQAFRFNNRRMNDFERFRAVLRDLTGKRLTYKELTSADLLPATT